MLNNIQALRFFAAFAVVLFHSRKLFEQLGLQADAGDWTAARRTLGAKLKHGSLPRDVHRRRDAVLALGEVAELVSETASIEAREAVIAANRQSPDLIPAAVMASDAYVKQGKPKYATRVIRKAWESSW